MMYVPREVEALDLDQAVEDPHIRGAALGDHHGVPTTTGGLLEVTGMGGALRSEDITLTTSE